MAASTFRVGDLVMAASRDDWHSGDILCRIIESRGDIHALQPVQHGSPRSVSGDRLILIEPWHGPELRRCNVDLSEIEEVPGSDEAKASPSWKRSRQVFRAGRCDSAYDFDLDEEKGKRRHLDAWMRSDPEVVTKTDEGLLWHKPDDGGGQYFLVPQQSSPQRVIFCVRYGSYSPRGHDAIWMTSWFNICCGTSWRKAKTTVVFDELLARYRLVVSRADLISSATRHWMYNISYTRERGHRGGIIMRDGTLSYDDERNMSAEWLRKHRITREGALPMRGERFFLERA